MAVSNAAPALAPLIMPTPPVNERGHPGGFCRDSSGALVLADGALYQAAIAQRIVMRFAVLLESHAEISARYGYSIRQIKQIATGRAWSALTRPVRLRLTALGLGDYQLRRTPAGRERLKAVMQRLAAEAANIIDGPHHFEAEYRQQVATDLFLLSGAWREEQP